MAVRRNNFLLRAKQHCRDCRDKRTRQANHCRMQNMILHKFMILLVENMN